MKSFRPTLISSTIPGSGLNFPPALTENVSRTILHGKAKLTAARLMPSTRVRFENSRNILLSGIIDWPEDRTEKLALFSHCFTCTKDLKAIARISRGLARKGIAVLRFDFTGLGDSKGSFSESNFETNTDDILSAVKFLNAEHIAPQLLIGHSLGGAAMISVAPQINSARAISTLASPSDTYHLAEFLSSQNPKIESEGEGEVTIGGRTYLMKAQLLESLRRQPMEERLSELKLPFLVFHSPEDETLAYRHATQMHQRAGGPTSIVTLDSSDHLLVKRSDDVEFVANILATWSARYLDQ
jgi:putative redox protein